MSAQAEGKVGEATRVQQVGLVTALLTELERQGIKELTERQMNGVIEAADLLVTRLERPVRTAEPGSGLMAWWTSDGTGLSSRCMVRHLAPHAGIQFPFPPETHFKGEHYPRDPADLNRCMKLLAAAPELAPHVGKMAEVSPAWAVVAGAWDELTALLTSEIEGSKSGLAPLTYKRMQELLKGVGA